MSRLGLGLGLTVRRGGGASWSPASVPGYLGYWGPRGRYTNNGMGTAVSLTDTTTGVGYWKDVATGGAGLALTGTGGPVGDGIGGLLCNLSTYYTLPAGLWAVARTAVMIAAPQTTGAGGSLPLAAIGSGPPFGGLVWTLGDRNTNPGNGAQLLWTSGGDTRTTTTSLMAPHAMIGPDVTVQTEPARPYWFVTDAAGDRMGVGGEESAYSANATVHGLSFRADPATVGFWNGSWHINGAICSLLLSSEALTAAQLRTAIVGMEADLRATLNLKPNVILHGNSWVDGGANSAPGDEVLRFTPLMKAALGSTWQVIDAGTGGITWQNLAALTGGAGLAGYAACYRDSRRKNALVAIEEQNDYNVGLRTAAQVVADGETYWTRAAALSPYASIGGWDKRFVVAPSWGGFTGSTAQKLLDWGTIRDSRVVSYGTYGDALIRMDMLPHIGLGTILTDPTYWQSENHPSSLGNQEIVEHPTYGMAAAVRAAFGL